MLRAVFTGNYEQYFSNLRPRVRRELNGQSDAIAHIVRKNTNPVTPKRKGKLRSSFRKTKTYGTNKVVVEVEYRARNERTGFIYSYIQEHRQYRHYTTPGTGPRYLRKGLNKSTTQVRNKYVETMRRAVRGA